MKTVIKQSVIITRIIAIIFISLFYASCNDILDLHSGQVAVSFTIADFDARTVLPPAISLSDVANFKLYGGRNNGIEDLLAEFNTGGTTVHLRLGTWNFTLNGYNDAGEQILQGKVENKVISPNGKNDNKNNNVVLYLSLFNPSIKGEIHITIIFPPSCNIDRVITGGDIGVEEFDVTGSIQFDYYKTNVMGDRFISFMLCQGNELKIIVSEFVKVRNALISEKVISLTDDDLKPVSTSGTDTNLSDDNFELITFTNDYYNSGNFGTYRIVRGSNDPPNDVIIPAGYKGLLVTEISYDAFYYCANLTSVTIPAGVTSIGNNTFGCCYNLTSVTFQGTIPSSGFNIDAFRNIGNLRDVFYAADKANGTSGTYTTANPGEYAVWMRQ